MKSVGAVLDEAKGLGKGFDFLRIFLSVSVVGWHAYQIAKDGYSPGPGPLWIFYNSVLIMFFGLSGFLIAGSGQRLSLKNFLINRGLRIFPALSVEVALSAFILGPIFTTFALVEYFTNYKFFLYLGNLLGIVYFHLPGVFGGNWVNGSLWTVPYEMGCYFVISLLIYFRLLFKRWSVLLLAAALLGIQLFLAYAGYTGQSEHARSAADLIRLTPAILADRLFYSEGSKLLVSFAIGIALYLYRYEIPYSRILFAGALVFVLVAESIGQWSGDNNPVSNTFLIPPVLYMTIFLGLAPLPTLPLFHRGDYSYGIYLYGWPFTMAVKTMFPEASRNFAFLFIGAMIPTCLFAAASWHLIERPILQLRKKFSFVARQRLAEAPATEDAVTGAPKASPIS